VLGTVNAIIITFREGSADYCTLGTLSIYAPGLLLQGGTWINSYELRQFQAALKRDAAGIAQYGHLRHYRGHCGVYFLKYTVSGAISLP